jgi:hypothetical protein
VDRLTGTANICPGLVCGFLREQDFFRGRLAQGVGSESTTVWPPSAFFRLGVKIGMAITIISGWIREVTFNLEHEGHEWAICGDQAVKARSARARACSAGSRPGIRGWLMRPGSAPTA